VNLSGRAIGPDTHVQTGSVTLNDSSSPQFDNYGGLENNYGVIHFNVPANQNRLAASIAYPGTPANGNNSRVRLILIDPLGRLAAHSLPQGVGNYGSVDVVDPAPGQWTGVIFGDVAADGGTNGAVPWQVATERYVPFGHVTPAHLSLQPGQSGVVTVSATTPASPGDASGSIDISSSSGAPNTSIPVTLRSQIDPATGGAFTGVLTGGNGRPPGEGQEEFYEFQVPAGVQNITANVSLTNDASDPVGSYLVDPDGDTVGYGENTFNGSPETTLTAYALAPAAGTWTLLVDFAEPVVGNEVAQPYSGSVVFNAVSASASGLPTSASTTLAAGKAVTVPVTFTNNGAAPEDFFLDPRLDASQTITLDPVDQAADLSLPLTGDEPQWLVPSQTSSVTSTSTASLPIMFDMGSDVGDPDIGSAPNGPGPLCTDTATASYLPADGTVTPGLWFSAPTECGPYSGPAPTGTVSSTMVARTQGFDGAVSSPTGDLWLASTTASLAGFQPGQTVTIDVTITPAGSAGSVVSGTLYVDVFEGSVTPYSQLSGDELAALPYTYTIK
jgi:hypothetical protein